VSRKLPSIIFGILAVIVTLSTVMNVFGDNSDVIRMAESQVCQNKAKCSYAKTSVARTPIGQYVSFSDGKSTLEVTCRRAAIAFGDYSCSAAKAP
jgi:hypothetical protein